MKRISKLKVLGAVATGALMLGATMAGAAAAGTIPSRSWWIDPETGNPNVVLAVGAQANASDVVSAASIAAQVGNMASIEVTEERERAAAVTFDGMMEYNYSYSPWIAKSDTDAEIDFATYFVDYELFSQRFWETKEDGGVKGYTIPGYDKTVAIAMPGEVKDDNRTVAKELSTLWYSKSPSQWDTGNSIYKSGIAALQTKYGDYAGGSYDAGNDRFEFDYGFFDTKAWVSVDDMDCGYKHGGTGTAMEPHEAIQVIFGDLTKCVGPTCQGDGHVDLFGNQGLASGIIYRTTEIRYPLLETGQNICGFSPEDGMIDFELARTGRLPQIKFLGDYYTPLFAGHTIYDDKVDLGGYFVYGEPLAEKEKIMRVGEQYEFGGYTVTLNDVNIYENKAFWTVEGPALENPFTFIQVMDSMDKCGYECCPECAIYGGGGAFTSNPTQRSQYDPYKVVASQDVTVGGRPYTLFKYTAFMLDGIKTFVGADGSYLAEVNLYALEDMGYLRSSGCCDPFVTTPNDYGLAITGGWLKTISTDGELSDQYLIGEPTPLQIDYKDNTYIYKWEDVNTTALYPQYYSEGYVQWQPQPSTGFTPDARFDTLELRLCDTIEVPDCETEFTIMGPNNYFSIVIEDLDFGRFSDDLTNLDGKKDSSGNPWTGNWGDIWDGVYAGGVGGSDRDGVKFSIEMASGDRDSTITYTKSIKIDPIDLVKLDLEINTETLDKNLVLIGGPVFNTLVKDLVDDEKSEVDWFQSAGDWELILDPYARGVDVLIIAGANREATRLAADQAVAALQQL